MIALAIVVLVFGVTYLNRGAMLLGSPVTLQSAASTVLDGGAAPALGDEYATGTDGMVEVPLTIANVRFEPSTLDIPTGVPVRLVVDRQEANACSDQLAIPQLGVLVDLAPNAVTVVELPAVEAGSYTLTCGMGMMSGQLRVGSSGAGSTGNDGPSIALALALVGILAAGAALARTATGSDRRALGFTEFELAVVIISIAIAVLAGLALGGLL